MAEQKKVTQREYYNKLLNLEQVRADAELVQFINGRIEMLNRKNSSSQDGEKKPTATQIANEKIKEEILAEMSAHPDKIYSCGDIEDFLEPSYPTITNQKVSRLLNDMAKETDGRVVKIIEKRKPYFQIAPVPTEVEE